jgi:hypothetical protein
MARDVPLGLIVTCRTLGLLSFACLSTGWGLNGDWPKIPPLADLVIQAT